MQQLRKTVVIRGELDANKNPVLRLAERTISPASRARPTQGLGPSVKKQLAPTTVIKLEDEGRTLYVTAQLGLIAEQPDVWVIGFAPPLESDFPQWNIRWEGKEGDPSAALRVTLTRDGKVTVLEA